MIRLDHVDKRRNLGKMDDGVVCVNRDDGDIFRGGRGEGGDVRKELVSPDLHSIIEERVALPIVQDSPTERCSPFYLLRVPEVSGPCSSVATTRLLQISILLSKMLISH